jgi:two-component system, cell cycle response regulator DivK
MGPRDKKSPTSAARSRSRVRPPVVLVVDDFGDNREMYCEYLEHAGFRVLEARDGESAIEVARARLPSVIVMDLSLPGIDGCEATRVLKSDPATKGISIIVLTGRAEVTARERATSAGCDLFMTKPCLPIELARAVAKCLDAAMSAST